MAQASRLRPQSDPFAAHRRRLDSEKLAQPPAISQEGQLSNTPHPASSGSGTARAARHGRTRSWACHSAPSGGSRRPLALQGWSCVVVLSRCVRVISPPPAPHSASPSRRPASECAIRAGFPPPASCRAVRLPSPTHTVTLPAGFPLASSISRVQAVLPWPGVSEMRATRQSLGSPWRMRRIFSCAGAGRSLRPWGGVALEAVSASIVHSGRL